MRTLILSDFHLGRARRHSGRADAFRPLWQGFDRLVLGGDTAEIMHPQRRGRALSAVERLFDLCAKDGVESLAITGNHDPTISEMFGLSLHGGEVFITHGDGFHPAVTPWSQIAPALRVRRAAALAENRRSVHIDGPDADLRAARDASLLEWQALLARGGRGYRSILTRPWALLSVPFYWVSYPRLAQSFADRHELAARFVIFGHTHFSGIWRRGDRTIINTGSFSPLGRPRAVTLTDDGLCVFDVKRHATGYRLSSAPRARFALTQPSSEDDLANVESITPHARRTREGRGRPSAVSI